MPFTAFICFYFYQLGIHFLTTRKKQHRNGAASLVIIWQPWEFRREWDGRVNAWKQPVNHATGHQLPTPADLLHCLILPSNTSWPELLLRRWNQQWLPNSMWRKRQEQNLKTTQSIFYHCVWLTSTPSHWKPHPFSICTSSKFLIFVFTSQIWAASWAPYGQF